MRLLKKEIFLVLLLSIFLAGCGKPVNEPITLDNLAGKRIAVMIGYSTDYLLSGADYDLDIQQ